MPMTVKNHRGKEVVLVDYSNLSSTAAIKLLHESVDFMASYRGQLLFVGDFTGTAVGPDFMAMAKSLDKKWMPRTHRRALVGIDGLKKVLLQGYTKFTGADLPTFNNLQTALDHVTA